MLLNIVALNLKLENLFQFENFSRLCHNITWANYFFFQLTYPCDLFVELKFLCFICNDRNFVFDIQLVLFDDKLKDFVFDEFHSINLVCIQPVSLRLPVVVVLYCLLTADHFLFVFKLLRIMLVFPLNKRCNVFQLEVKFFLFFHVLILQI